MPITPTTATRFWTLAEFQSKIRRDLDLEEETFVRPQELTDYINEAIDEAEALIHGLYQDYFLSRYPLRLVANQEEYDLPPNIYGDMIRRVMYNNTSSVYEIKPSRAWRKFEKYEIARTFETSDLYQYFLLNSVPGQVKILLTPPAREDGDYVTVWYIRQANRLVAPDDICDMKEAQNFILQHVKCRIYEKEGHPNSALAAQRLLREQDIMEGVLADRAPDANNEIELDMSFYEEFN